MALFPLVLIRSKSLAQNPELINHEKIHLRQQLEMLVIPFYILYLFLYLFNLMRFRNHDAAYRNIAFEKEAYQHETNLNYLQTRKFWSWIR